MVYSSDSDEYNWYNDEEESEDEVEEPLVELDLGKLSLGPKKNKLIVFSLNGLLIHRAHRRDRFSIPNNNRRPDGVYNNGTRLVYKRAFLDEFMKFCLERFEVGLWSSAQEHNVDLVLDCAFKGVKSRLLFVWDQEQCTDSKFKTLENKRKPLFLKELSKLCSSLANSSRGARFSESNTLLVDDGPSKGLLNQPHSGIYPDSYDPNDANDNALDPKEELGQYLEALAKFEDDVPSFVKDNPFGQPAIGPEHPNWDFYSKVLRRLNNN